MGPFSKSANLGRYLGCNKMIQCILKGFCKCGLRVDALTTALGKEFHFDIILGEKLCL